MAELTKKDWTSLDNGEVFYDKDEESYVIVVTSPESSIGDEQQIEQIGEGLTPEAVSGIASYYDKKFTSEEVKFLNESTEYITFYLEERKGSFLKFKYALKKEAWDSLIKEEKQEPIISDIKVLVTSDLFKRFQVVADYFNIIDKKIVNDGVDIRPFDASVESDLILKVPSTIKSLLTKNNKKLRSDEDDEIVLNLTSDYEIESIFLIEEGFKQTEIKAGLNLEKDKEPFNSPRTVKYVSMIDKMYAEIRSKSDPEGWYNFLSKYTLNLPQWSPSKPIKEPELGPLTKISSGLKTSKTFNTLKDEFSAPYKDAKKVLTEVAQLTAEFKIKTANTVKNLEDFVSDNQIAEKLKNSNALSSLEDLYEQLLNKISIENLLNIAANSVASCLPLGDAINQWRKGGLMSLDVGMLISSIEALVSEEDFEEISGKVNSKFSLGDCEPQKLQPQQAKKIKKEYIDLLFDKLESLGTLEEVSEKIEELIPYLENLGENAINKLEVFVEEADEMIAKEVSNFVQKNLPKPPTLTIPDNFPIVDLLESLPKAIEDTIVETVEQTIIQLVKNLAQISDQIENVGPFCQDKKNPENYGTVGLDDVVPNADAFVPMNEVLERFGFFPDDISADSLDAEDEGDDVDSEEQDDIPQIAKLLRDILELLTTREVCALFQGRATESSMKIVKNFMLKKYPMLLDGLRSDSIINQFFKELSVFMDLTVCALPIGPETRSTDPCNPLELPSFDNMPTNLLEDQRNREREKNKKLLEEIADLIQGESNLDDLLPPHCDPNSINNIIQNDPTVEFLTDITFDTFFQSLILSFNTEVVAFSSNLIEVSTEEDPQAIQEAGVDPSGNLKTVVFPSLISDLQNLNNFNWNGQTGQDDLAGYSLAQKTPDSTITYSMVGIPSYVENNDEEDESEDNIGTDRADDVSIVAAKNEFSTIVNRIEDRPFYDEYVKPYSPGEFLNKPQKSIAFKRLFRKAIDGSIKAIKQEQFEIFLNTVSNKHYYDLFVLTLSQYAKLVSESRFFDPKVLANLDLAPVSSNPKKGEVIGCTADNEPVVSPSPLLDIESIKMKASQRNKELSCVPCEEPMNDSVKKTLLESSIELTYRFYAIQNALCDVFSYSIYNYEKVITNDISVNIAINDLDKGLDALGYRDIFEDETLKYVQNRINPDIENIGAAKEIIIGQQMNDLKDSVNSIMQTSQKQKTFFDSLPIIDPPSDVTSIRLSDFENLTVLNPENKFKLSSLDKGGIFVERYVRLVKKDGALSGVDFADGVYSLDLIQSYISNGFFQVDTATKIEDVFDVFRYGMRVSIVVPDGLEKIFADQALFGPDKDSKLNMDAILREKSYIIVEGNNVDTASWNNYRNSVGVKFEVVPIMSTEKSVEANVFYDLLEITSDEESGLRRQYPFDEFRENILESKEYSALDYSISEGEIISLISLYNKIAVNSRVDFDSIFASTKKTLKSMFLTSLSDNYQHKGDTDSKGASDDFVNSQISVRDSSDSSGFAAAMALLTPLWIIKGVAEYIDPHVILANLLRKIDGAPSSEFLKYSDKLILTPPPGPFGYALRDLAFKEKPEKQNPVEKQCEDN